MTEHKYQTRSKGDIQLIPIVDQDESSSQVSATTEKMNNNITISSQIIKTDVNISFDQLPPTQNDNPSLAEIIDCVQREEIVVNQIITVVDRLNNTNNLTLPINPVTSSSALSIVTASTGNLNLPELFVDRKQIFHDYREIMDCLQRHQIVIDKLIELLYQVLTTSNFGSLTEHTTSPTSTPSTTDHVTKQLRSKQISQLFEVVDQELVFDHTQDEKHQSMFLVTDMLDLPSVQEIGTQTESSSYLSTAVINPNHESTAIAYSKQPADDVPPLTICKERSITWVAKSHWQIQKDTSSITTYIIDKQLKFSSKLRFNNSSNYVLTKLLFSTLLLVMIICQLLVGSMVNEKDVNSVPIINRHMVSTNIIYSNAIPILIATLIPFSSISKGPGRSMFELWFYPFVVP